MKIFLLLFTLLFSSLYAKCIKAGYDVSFGIVGEIGKAEITYTQEDDSYTIVVHAWTTGMSALITQNRQESYISQGRIIDNDLRPDVFVKFKQSDRYTKSSVFLFNHEDQEVFEHKANEHYGTKNHYDITTMKTIQVPSEEFDFREDLFRFYTGNDLLSLFFNTKKILPTMKSGEKKELAAIGSKTPNCIIDIEVPDDEQTKVLQEVMLDDVGLLLTIVLHQDIFQSKEGRLHVILDDDGFATNVLLKDVILFGDIRGKRTYLEK